MKKMNFKSESGFTLMELMVVVGVLAILIAILLPQFTGYTAQAQAVSASAQVKNALTAGYSYYTSFTSRNTASFGSAQQTTAISRMQKAVKNNGTFAAGSSDTEVVYTIKKGNLEFYATLDLANGSVLGASTGDAGTTGINGSMGCSGSACADLLAEGALVVQ